MVFALTLVALFVLGGVTYFVPQTEASSQSNSSRIDLYQVLHHLLIQSGCAKQNYSSFSLQYCTVDNGSNASVTESLLQLPNALLQLPSVNKVVNSFVLSQLSNGSVLVTKNSKQIAVSPGQYMMDPSVSVQYSYDVDIYSGGSGSSSSCADTWTSSTSVNAGDVYLTWNGYMTAQFPSSMCILDYGLTQVTYSVTDNYLFSVSGNFYQTPKGGPTYVGYDSDWGTGYPGITTTTTQTWDYVCCTGPM